MTDLAVSVIVPTYNRPDRLARCIAALARQEAPAGGFEIVVVDDGSREPVQVEPALSEQVTVVRQANAGPAAARNAGAARARGRLLAFTDDDCAPDQGWVQALARAARSHPRHLLAGRTINALPDNPYATASQVLMDYLGVYFGPTSGRVPLVASNNMAVPAEAFRALGGFDRGFPLAAGEDRDFCARWYEAGKATAAVPEAVVYHAHRMNLTQFWRQHRNYGYGAYRYHHLRPPRTRRREPWWFYRDLIVYPFRADTDRNAWQLAMLLGLSQVANAAGYATAALAARRAQERSGAGRPPGSRASSPREGWPAEHV